MKADDGRSGSADEYDDLDWTCETAGMKQLRCCLTLPERLELVPVVRDLSPSKVMVQLRREHGIGEEQVDFPGGLVCMLREVNGKGSNFPLLLCIAGECRLGREDVEQLRVQYEQDAKFRWPDYAASLQCPRCKRVAQAGGEEQVYVMVWQCILQLVEDRGVVSTAMRTIPRITCRSCFEALAGHLKVEAVGGTAPSLPPPSGSDSEKEEGYRMLPVLPDVMRRTGVRLDAPVAARTLLQRWEETGMFAAFCSDVGRGITEMLSGAGPGPGASEQRSGRALGAGAAGAGSEGAALRPTSARCARSGCNEVASKRCGRCQRVAYCSARCQRLDWKAHKVECKRSVGGPLESVRVCDSKEGLGDKGVPSWFLEPS